LLGYGEKEESTEEQMQSAVSNLIMPMGYVSGPSLYKALMKAYPSMKEEWAKFAKSVPMRAKERLSEFRIADPKTYSQEFAETAKSAQETLRLTLTPEWYQENLGLIREKWPGLLGTKSGRALEKGETTIYMRDPKTALDPSYMETTPYHEFTHLIRQILGIPYNVSTRAEEEAVARGSHLFRDFTEKELRQMGQLSEGTAPVAQALQSWKSVWGMKPRLGELKDVPIISDPAEEYLKGTSPFQKSLRRASKKGKIKNVEPHEEPGAPWRD
jgi:hypothetical protein